EDKLNRLKVGYVPTLIYIPDFITDTEQTQLLNKIYEALVSKWKILKYRRLQNWGGVVHEKGLLPNLPPWLTKITQRICEESGLFQSAINHVLINEYLPNQGIMPHQDVPAYFPVVAILSLGSPVVMDFTPHSRVRSCINMCNYPVGDKSTDEEALAIKAENRKDNHYPFSVLLMPCSLLIFKDDAYSDYLHGIKENEIQQYDEDVNEVQALKHYKVDSPLSASEKTGESLNNGDVKVINRNTNRISLACRLVLKVNKKLFKFKNVKLSFQC
ncbi:LOW QUALITY PROTEIN: 2OG-FeII_Oxy_2 domain-containing protein, partial [Cephalotus follicularis]